jgi:hypothetical protein
VQAYKTAKHNYLAAIEQDLLSDSSTITGAAKPADRPSMLNVPEDEWQQMKENAKRIAWPGRVTMRSRKPASGALLRGNSKKDPQSRAAMHGATMRCVSCLCSICSLSTEFSNSQAVMRLHFVMVV